MSNSLDLERVLISKIVYTGRVETAMASGIDRRHFGDKVVGDIWEFVAKHFITYQSPPSHELVGAAFPNYDFTHSSDPLDLYLDRFRDEIKRREVNDALMDIALAMKDPKNLRNIDEQLLERARKVVELLPQPRVARFSEMDRRIDEYRARALVGQNFGIKMGIPKIDNMTFGIQPSDFVSISGWQGLGKSTVLQHILMCAYLQGKTPMIFSIEMDKDTLLRRWDTMRTHFVYRNLKGLTLSDDELELWEQEAKDVSARQNDIIILDDVGACTVDFVYSKMQAYKPDLVGIDYISLMTPPKQTGNLWQDLTHITQALKQIARRTRIPVIVVAQTNKASADGGAELDNIAYTRSIGQDSDIAIGLHRSDEMIENSQMEIRLMKNRDGSQTSAMMRWMPETMHFREWSFSDQFLPRDAEDSRPFIPGRPWCPQH